MVKLSFKSEEQKLLMLFSLNLSDLILATHLVRLVNEIIDRLDLLEILQSYKEAETAASVSA